jgi:uncharacterized repeat protein (TIGR04138 family)
MANDPSPQERLQSLIKQDARYPMEAYEFLFAALGFVQHRLREQGKIPGEEAGHVTGQQLAEGCRDLALQEFGLMARTVFRLWNINKTDDFGEMIYNLIEIGLMRKTDTDRKEDFSNVFDMEQALGGYRIQFGE